MQKTFSESPVALCVCLCVCVCVCVCLMWEAALAFSVQM